MFTCISDHLSYKNTLVNIGIVKKGGVCLLHVLIRIVLIASDSLTDYPY